MLPAGPALYHLCIIIDANVFTILRPILLDRLQTLPRLSWMLYILMAAEGELE